MTSVARRRLSSGTHSPYNIKVITFAALFIAGVLLLALSSVTNYRFLGGASASSASASAQMSGEKSKPFSLLVKLVFTAEEHKSTFLKDIAPLAEYVKLHELDTIAYEVLLSDKDPLQVLILERYKDKENAFLSVHRSSNPFLEFRPKLQALEQAGFVTIQGESYLDAGVGFGDRAN
jgi:quinol monooxygenase YgiN